MAVSTFFLFQKLIFGHFWNCKKWNLVKKKCVKLNYLFDFMSFFWPGLFYFLAHCEKMSLRKLIFYLSIHSSNSRDIEPPWKVSEVSSLVTFIICLTLEDSSSSSLEFGAYNLYMAQKRRTKYKYCFFLLGGTKYIRGRSHSLMTSLVFPGILTLPLCHQFYSISFIL